MPGGIARQGAGVYSVVQREGNRPGQVGRIVRGVAEGNSPEESLGSCGCSRGIETNLQHRVAGTKKGSIDGADGDPVVVDRGSPGGGRPRGGDATCSVDNGQLIGASAICGDLGLQETRIETGRQVRIGHRSRRCNGQWDTIFGVRNTGGTSQYRRVVHQSDGECSSCHHGEA